MQNEKSKHKIKDENSRDNNLIKDQKIDSELKRFKSHGVFLVNQKIQKYHQKTKTLQKTTKK